LSWLHADIADDSIPLVEKRNHRHSFVHGRDGSSVTRTGSGAAKLDAVLLILVVALTACRKQQRQ
jgi:hypothetical protein